MDAGAMLERDDARTEAAIARAREQGDTTLAAALEEARRLRNPGVRDVG